MTTPAEFYETHRELLDKAIEAAATRDYWSAYPAGTTKGVGRGYSLTGHHEIMIPLLAAMLVEADRGRRP